MTVDPALVDRIDAIVGDELAEVMGVADESGEPFDTEDRREFTVRAVKHQLKRLRQSALTDGRRPFDATEEEELLGVVLDRIHGLGRIQPLIDNPKIRNIHINGCDNVWVEYSDGTVAREAAVADSDHQLTQLIASVGRRVGLNERQWDDANFALNLQLPGGERLHAIRGVTSRPSVTIRSHDWSINRLDHLVDLGEIDKAIAAFLEASVRARLNIVVAGATSVGKTTLLRCLLNTIPSSERLVTIEDNLEIGLDRFLTEHPDQVVMEERPPNIEKEGSVPMADLVRQALRMNPSRIIVGEVRGVEALEMLQAMSTGNEGSMCTIHAASSKGTVERLMAYTSRGGWDPDTCLRTIAMAVDLIVHVGWVGGIRRVTSIREVTGYDGSTVSTNEVFWSATDGSAVPAPGPTISDETLRRLEKSGFDSALLHREEGWWAE